MTVLVTGAAGFIGSFVAHRLLDRGDEVVGLDNISDYYDPKLKLARLARLEARNGFRFLRQDIAAGDEMKKLFAENRFDTVIHLAAQAGVRHSIENPGAYAQSNLVGFTNIIEGCRHSGVKHLVFASSSSVYGANEKLPFSVSDNVDHPVSFYAATKKANELMAHSYAHLYRLPVTGLRFFTVYGPWGRPDMALFQFVRSILAGEPIDVFNHGRHMRDFTYIDDIAEGVVRVADRIATPSDRWDPKAPDPAISSAPYRLYNIGNNRPVRLLDFIAAIEKALGKKAKMNMLPLQKGDVEATYADIEALREAVGFSPSTPIEEGIGRFVEWYRGYYGV
ncbi:MAG: capsular biosynthesis protein CpsI [Rhizobiales bacterium 65-79]|nr:NAD-dependent epimerase [Hyphomicrobiales bacterium]OJU01270.1 MAG: capsular biosynthesis protein CpsI [Rhizobiales bacterium 65-79]